MADFLIDAQLPPKLAEYLRSLGHTAVHVSDCGLGDARDNDVWQEAIARSCILVSKDEDFVRLANVVPHRCKLLWVRLGNTTNRALSRSMGAVLPEIVEEFERGGWLVELV